MGAKKGRKKELFVYIYIYMYIYNVFNTQQIVGCYFAFCLTINTKVWLHIRFTLTQTDKSILYKHDNGNGMTKGSVQFRPPQLQLAVRPEMVMGEISYCLVLVSAIPRIEKCFTHLLRSVNSTMIFYLSEGVDLIDV